MRTLEGTRCGILLTFATLLLVLLINGNAVNYVHPRFQWGLTLSCAVLFLLAAVRIGRLWNGHHHSYAQPQRRPWLACFIMILPLCFAVLPDSTLGSYMVEMKEKDPAATQSTTNTAPPSTASAVVQAWDPVIKDEEFTTVMMMLYNKPEDYTDQEIEYVGFVYHQEDFPEDSFVAARFAIICCAADAQVAGLLCHFPEAATLKKDQWVRIKGRIQTRMYQSRVIPVVEVSMVQMVKPPLNPYVY